MLGLDQFFGERIHGALDDPGAFSKAQVIERILGDHAIDGESLVGFGDGFVEIQNIRETGGLAVAVASERKAVAVPYLNAVPGEEARIVRCVRRERPVHKGGGAGMRRRGLSCTEKAA